VIEISAREGEGLEALRSAILSRLRGDEASTELPAVSNVRHLALLGEAASALRRGRAGCGEGVPEEFVLVELAAAAGALQQITGARSTDEMLGEIFSRFCIGK